MNWTSIIGIALWALIPGFIAKNKGRNFWAYYFLSFLITPLITMIITACLKNITNTLSSSNQDRFSADNILSNYNHGNNGDVVPLENHGSGIESINQNAISQRIKKILYCRKCGYKLIDGSELCSNCGTKIESEGTAQ